VKLERENIIKALNITNWKISGDGGAADLLKLPRTTLTSKIKKLDIRRVAL
jgi:transcriptional regulator with GAF, ATPase, and Fis domain